MIVKRELLQFSPRVGPKSSITITRINLFFIRQIALNFAFGSLHYLLNYLMSLIPIYQQFGNSCLAISVSISFDISQN